MMKILHLVAIFLCANFILKNLLAKDRHGNWILVSLLGTTLVIVFHAYLFHSNLLTNYPHLIHIEIPFLYLIAPLLYLVLKMQVSNLGKFDKRWLAYFIVPICVLVSLSFFYFQNSEYKLWAFSKLIQYKSLDWIAVIFGIGALHLVLFIFLIFRELSPIWNWQSFKNETMAWFSLLLFLGATLSAGLWLAGVVLRDFELLKYAAGNLSMLIVAGHILSLRYPHLLVTVGSLVKKEKYIRSLNKDIDLKIVQADLDRLMNKEKVFLDDELTLEDLAMELRITRHQVSQYLNEVMGQNFSTYINSFRVEEAKMLLVDNPKMSVLDIAYRAGFRTKSVFNNSFRRATNMSPTQFRIDSSNKP